MTSTTSAGTTTSPGTLAGHWAALATTALLGSDRRPAPEPPPGPLADLLAERDGLGRGDGAEIDHPGRDAAETVLDQVALLAAVRRAGLRPNAVAAPLVLCPPDLRPECPPAAVRRLEQLLVEWPPLVDEWLQRVSAGGWSLPPEVAVALLGRYRADPGRRAFVAGLAGELAGWLAELFPAELAPRKVAARQDQGSRAGSSGSSVADVPIPDDIARLGTLAPAELATTLATALARGHFANRHRAPLVRLVSALPMDCLAPLAEALSRSATNPNTMGLTLTLADLAQTRLDLIRELM